MTFTSYLKFKNLLCHDENIHVEGEQRDIYCLTCKGYVLNLNKHLTQELDSLLSCQIAQYYANWSGDIHVPCKIKIVNIPGIMPSEIIVPYSILINVIKLLEVVNQEFIFQKNKNFEISMTLQNKILKNFINQYSNISSKLQIDESDSESDGTQKLLDYAIQQISSKFNDKQLFEYYINELCPYVKSCLEFSPEVKESVITSPGEYFLILSNDATRIRSCFSKFSIYFDLIYLMIYSYLCQEEHDLLVNFTFDFISRLCKGYFDDTNVYIEYAKKIINNCVSYKQNTHLHYLIQHIRKGEIVEHLSQEFLENYSELQQVVWNEFVKVISAPNDQFQKYAFSQSYPFALFPNGANYYAFIITLAYLSSKIVFKTASFEKGTILTAKKIFHFIEENMNNISNFQKEGSPILCWNKDTLDMYLSIDKNLINNIKELFIHLKPKRKNEQQTQ